MKGVKLMLFPCLVVPLCISISYADVPQMINYQGKLTNPNGVLISDTLSITFTIYDDSMVGSVLWAETLSSVIVEYGVFSVLLGSVNPIPDLVFSGDVRYLGIKVGSDSEMSPRKAIVSVGYAYKAEHADTAGFALAAAGVGDTDWIYRITDTADTTLMTGGKWGIARYGNNLIGYNDSTHVNLGVASTTGFGGYDMKYCTVGGGVFNSASFNSATVSGGVENSASNTASTVGGGGENSASEFAATVGGGFYNEASGFSATVGGGYWDTASGHYATVPGGFRNAATGDYSFAAGRRAKAVHNGSFVWADAADADFASTANNQFLIRASGGVGIGTNSPAERLDVTGTVQMTGFKMPTAASNGYVLTSNASGVGTWQAAPTGMGGSGTANYIPKFTDFTTLGNSVIYETGGNVGIGSTSPTQKLTVNGHIDMIEGQSRIHGVGEISFDWTTGSTYDVPDYHGVQSKDEAGNWDTGIRINSMDDITNTLDANNTNSTSYFKIQHHSPADGEDLFWVRSSDGYAYHSGNLGIGTTNPTNPVWEYGTVLEIVEPTTNDAAAIVLRNLNSGTTHSNGGIIFGNQTEPDICRITGAADGAINSGKILFSTTNAGTPSSKMVIKANGDVGIGTATPTYGKLQVDDGRIAITGNDATLDLRPDGDEARILVSQLGKHLTVQARAGIRFWTHQEGTGWLERMRIDQDGGVGIGRYDSTIYSGDDLGEIFFYGTVEGNRQGAAILARARGTWSGTSSPAELWFKTTPSGSVTPVGRMVIDEDGEVGIGISSPSYKLDVNGDINVNGSYNIKKGGVNYNHPDYVFEPDYKLMSLEELKRYVFENKSLPNVISADDVRKNNGFKMDELLVQMLEKIEEQTLYIFQLEERIAKLEKKQQ